MKRIQMSEQKPKCHNTEPVRVLILHPIIRDYVELTQKVLKENGNDASYSVAINTMLLTAIMESKRPEGLSKETLEAVKDFVEDVNTIRELSPRESDLSFSVSTRAKACYIF